MLAPLSALRRPPSQNKSRAAAHRYPQRGKTKKHLISRADILTDPNLIKSLNERRSQGLHNSAATSMKQRFYRTLADNSVAVGIDARNLIVVLTENTLADWSFGNGVAQYLVNPPAPRSAE
ncbi:MAG: tautomerase family protein [Pseudonocardiaceae bacterium]